MGTLLDIVSPSKETRGIGLVAAVSVGNLGTAKLLLQSGADVGVANVWSHTALVTVAEIPDEERAVEMARHLISYKASLEIDSAARERGGPTPLVIAAADGREQLVSLLLEGHADPNVADGSRRLPLVCAVIVGKVNMCGMLLSHNADVNALGASGKPRQEVPGAVEQRPGVAPLSVAVGNHDIVGLLLRCRADTEVVDERHYTPLMSAARVADEVSCSLLLAAGARVDARQVRSEKTALMLSAAAGHRRVCVALLDSSACVNLVGSSGAAALHAAGATDTRMCARCWFGVGPKWIWLALAVGLPWRSRPWRVTTLMTCCRKRSTETSLALRCAFEASWKQCKKKRN